MFLHHVVSCQVIALHSMKVRFHFALLPCNWIRFAITCYHDWLLTSSANDKGDPSAPPNSARFLPKSTPRDYLWYVRPRLALVPSQATVIQTQWYTAKRTEKYGWEADRHRHYFASNKISWSWRSDLSPPQQKMCQTKFKDGTRSRYPLVSIQGLTVPSEWISHILVWHVVIQR